MFVMNNKLQLSVIVYTCSIKIFLYYYFENAKIRKIIIDNGANDASATIDYATDRKDHNMQYVIGSIKIQNELGYLLETKFADGIKTIKYYLENIIWLENIISDKYQNYYAKIYVTR